MTDMLQKNTELGALMNLSRKYNILFCKVLKDAYSLEDAGFTNIPEELDEYYKECCKEAMSNNMGDMQ